MPAMDDTTLDQKLTDLESADPADAPDLADAIASTLSDLLEDGEGDDTAPPA